MGIIGDLVVADDDATDLAKPARKMVDEVRLLARRAASDLSRAERKRRDALNKHRRTAESRVELLKQEDRLDGKMARLGDKESAQQRAERKLRKKQAEKQGRLEAVRKDLAQARRDLDRTRSEHGEALDDMAHDEGQLHCLDRALYEKAGQLASRRGDADRAVADVGHARKLLRVEQLRLDRVHRDCEQLGFDAKAFRDVTRKYEESQMDLWQAKRDHEDA